MPSRSGPARTLAALRKELHAAADPVDASFIQGFFKTAPGQYGAGDKFLGLRVDTLRRLVRSDDIWERRIAIVSTFHFIRAGEFRPTLKIAKLLVNDPHDLIHKAVGWMLREVGKRDRSAEDAFLLRHYRKMPRTMLRYAIERHPERVRKQYLKGTL